VVYQNDGRKTLQWTVVELTGSMSIQQFTGASKHLKPTFDDNSVNFHPISMFHDKMTDLLSRNLP
jgi:hypothetical protein